MNGTGSDHGFLLMMAAACFGAARIAYGNRKFISMTLMALLGAGIAGATALAALTR